MSTKKTFISCGAAVVLCALAVLTSCSKVEDVKSNPSDVPTSGEMKLNVTVATPGGDDSGTKAVLKDGWSKGDLIYVWYDSNTGTDANAILGYDGSGWYLYNYDKNITPASSGTLKGIYYDDSKHLAIATTSDYKYGNNTLNTNIENWSYLSEIKILVMGLSGSASDYSLACDQLYPLDGYTVGASGITATRGAKGDAVKGVANSGGAAFIFATSAAYDKSATYNFSLGKSGGQAQVMEQKNKTLAKIENFEKMRAITLTTNNSQWEGTTGTTGGHSWTQLWLGGPKWANFNIGSTITSYGSLNSGTDSTTGNVAYVNTANVGGLYGWHHSYNARKVAWGEVDYCLDFYPSYTRESLNDVATTIWGDNWREPTLDEIEALVANCTWKRYDGSSTKYVSGCILGGIAFFGKGSFSGNSVFFPYTGSYRSYDNNKSVVFNDESVYGYDSRYWTSKEDSPGSDESGLVYTLLISTGGLDAGNNWQTKYVGSPVRAVRAN